MNRKNSKKEFTILSLFSGGMGLDLGLAATGRFKTIACIEKEKSFCETIRKNRDAGRFAADLIVLEADIASLSPAETLANLGINPAEIDVIVGGPPCQSFSTAGRRGTTQDPRGTLLWDFLRFVDYVRPKYFLMENVRGLLSAALKHRPIADRPNKGGPPLEKDEERGSVVKLFAEDLANFDKGNYRLDIFEVNAVNYGSPQLRERVLFFGNRFGRVVDFPVPTHGPSNTSDKNKQQALFDDKELTPWATLADALADLEDENPVVLDFSPRKKMYLDMVPAGANWRSLPESVQSESMGKAWQAKGGRSGWWRRLSFDLPSPTLVTMPNHASTALCHPVETRALSIKEYSRIQEFPDDWAFCGTTAKQYAQIGNAVPVRLGRIAGSALLSELDAVSSDSSIDMSRLADKPRIVYLQSHVRTRQWFKNGESVVWSDGTSNEHARYPRAKNPKSC